MRPASIILRDGDAFWWRLEAHNKHGDVVGGVVVVSVLEQLVRRLLGVEGPAHEVDGALVVHDIPQL